MQLSEALEEAAALGIQVHLEVRGMTVPAGYHHATRTIWISDRVPARDVLPHVLHELEHAKAGHEGEQSDIIEARINRRVAEQLITPEEYARAELVAGGNSGAIAVELDLPRWVVSAYRRRLWAAGRGT